MIYRHFIYHDLVLYYIKKRYIQTQFIPETKLLMFSMHLWKSAFPRAIIQ